MSMGTSPNPGLFKTFAASGPVAPYTIVALDGSASGAVAAANDASDRLVGVTQQLGADIGERLDVCLGGLPEVRFGAAVSAGAPLTADAAGLAVEAAPAAGVQARIIGFALMDAVAGDIVPFQFAPGVITGATA